MHNYFLFFCFIYFSLNAQKRADLQLKTDDKISVHGFSYWQNIHISSKDTSFTVALHKKNPDVLPHLKLGTYTISIQSVFNTSVSKKISLKKNPTLANITGISTAFHKVSDTTFLTKRLKANDTLFIIYSTSQNSIENQKIAIVKTKTDITAIMYDGLTNQVFSYMHCSPNLYEHVINFENDCKTHSNPKAETAPNKDICTLALKKEITTFIIPENRNALDKLKAILFAIQK